MVEMVSDAAARLLDTQQKIRLDVPQDATGDGRLLRIESKAPGLTTVERTALLLVELRTRLEKLGYCIGRSLTER